MNDSRALLRARMSVRRHDLSARQRVEAAAGVLHSLESLPAFTTAPSVAGYWAVRGELPLNLVVTSLHRRQQHYFLPVVGAAHQLTFAQFNHEVPIRSNRYGIPEPDVAIDQHRDPRALDVILLPLLAFDPHGHRLGSGGGWYDASLEFLRGCARPATPLLIGVGYAFQQVAAIASEPWDAALDYVATEEGLLACHATVPAA